MAPDEEGVSRAAVLYEYRLVDAATGRTLRVEERCVLPGDDGEVPPGEATPPTIEEVLDAALVPEPAIRVSPNTDGITGMDTWFWADDPGEVNAGVELQGWTTSGTLSAESWTWDTGDGGSYDSSGPGSEDDPAATHVYETKGTYTVTATIEWAGTVTITGYGVSYTVDVLDATTSSDFPYDVDEVVSVVDEPDAD